MKIPFYYNIRNLRSRTGTTALTIAGIAITVVVIVLLTGLLAGLNRAFVANGDPLNLLLLRKGLDTEYASSVTRESFQTVKSLPGIAQTGDQQPMASLEVVTGIIVRRRDGSGDTNVTLRGVDTAGIQLRPRIRIIEGRWFTAGQREMVAGRALRTRFNVNVGSKLFFGRGEWTVVGVFDNQNTVQESELWADSNQIVSESPRPHFSSMLVRASDDQALAGLKEKIATDQRLGLSVFDEPEYYARQVAAGNSIKFIGWFIALIMAAGSCFAAANTMFASVAYRAPEIAVLRVMGFSRMNILQSFLLESIVVGCLGGLLGILLMIPFQGFTTGTMNSFTFSEMVFRLEITPGVVLIALAAAVLMGALGGIVPAWSAARQDIIVRLRE